jgi:glycosyltransferase involved in cell wall biosynthesis
VLVVVRWPLGGIRTHIAYTYPELVEAGYRFTFVGPEGESLTTFATSLRHLGESTFVAVPTRGANCPLWRTVRRLARQGNFGMLHSHGLTAATHTVVGNFGLGLPHLTTVHDVFRADQFNGIRGRLKRWLMARLLRRITAIVSVSQDVRSNLLEFMPAVGNGGSRLLTISNGIDCSHYHDHDLPPRPELRSRLKLGQDAVLLGFLGRFMEQKGFTTLLQSLERLRQEGSPRPFHLVAVGSGDRRGRYEKEVVERGLSDCVSMLDFVPDVLPLLRQLDVLVVPSLWEASSLVSMEAMSVGVPVLGSDCLGLREVLRETPSRMFAAGNVDDLARALRETIDSPWSDEAARFASQARRRFDCKQYAQQFCEVFDSLRLPGKSPSPLGGEGLG